MNPVIVYGPAASGKTRNANALRRRFGCSRVVDPWEGEPLHPGDLALTNASPSPDWPSAHVVPIAEAMLHINPQRKQ